MRLNDNNLTREQVIEDAGTTTVVNPLTITHNSTGTPAAGFGAGLAVQVETNTTPDTPIGGIEWRWRTATHASRKAEVAISGYTAAIKGNFFKARAPSDFGLASFNDLGAGAVDLHGRKDNITNVAAGTYSFMGPGVNNTVSNNYGVITGGANNTISANNAFIGSGNTNTVSGYAGFVASGTNNTVTGALASAFGTRAVASHSRSIALAGARFTTDGDAQTMIIPLSRQVTHSDANWYELFIDGAAERLDIPTDTVWTFQIFIVGATAGITKSFSFKIEGAIESVGTSVTLLASTVTTIYDGDDVSFDARALADDVNDALLIQVQDADAGGDIVKWVGTIIITSVTAA